MNDIEYLDYLNLEASLREAMEERIIHLEMPRWWQWLNRTWLAKLSRMNTRGVQQMYRTLERNTMSTTNQTKENTWE